MFVEVVTPPAGDVVSLAEAKAHLLVEHDLDDALIKRSVQAAVSHLDGPYGFLKRAVAVQGLRATVCGFNFSRLTLPFGPVTGVSDVRYIDVAGEERSVDPGVYRLGKGDYLELDYGQSWPTMRSAADPVQIFYTAGYPTLPAALQSAILLMVGDLYANRESSVEGTISAEIKSSLTVDRLLAPYRLLRV